MAQPAHIQSQDAETNDYHVVLPSDKQVKYARFLAARSGVAVPGDALADRLALSRWIDDQKSRQKSPSRFDRYPSSKQVGFAEALARRKRTSVPHECFKDKGLMSNWITSQL